MITVYDPIVRTFPLFSAVYTRAIGRKPNSAHLSFILSRMKPTCVLTTPGL